MRKLCLSLFAICSAATLACGTKPPPAAKGDGGATGCPPNQVMCGQVCVDVSSNPAHCGSCPNACGSSTPLCSAGACVATCPAGTRDCNGGCVNTTNDPNNCGFCGNSCGANGACISGVCSCSAGATYCAGAGCTNTTTDNANCGQCGVSCGPAGTCTSSSCVCEPGVQSCNGRICNADTQVDPNNCSQCGQTCNDTQVCVNGGCVCRPGLVLQGGNCVDPTCAGGCSGGTPLCLGGTCVSGCPSGTQNCNGSCVDPQTDPLNCGQCGNNCARDEFCAAGQCQGYRIGLGCTSCPCDSCRQRTCCPSGSGGVQAVTCVDGQTCPP